MSYTYKYPRPALTVDAIILRKAGLGFEVLLIQRGQEPFAGSWALPGGFVEMDECLDTAARRELEEETGIAIDKLEQLHTFDEPDRDPRGRTISVVHIGFFQDESQKEKAGDDAALAQWFPLESLPELAFDHKEVMIKAKEWLKSKI